VPLVKPKTDPTGETTELDELQTTAALLAELGAWARPESRFYESIPTDTPPLIQSLREWSSSDSLVFHIDGSTVGRARGFGERDDLEVNGTIVLDLAQTPKTNDIFTDVALTCMLKGFERANGGPHQFAPLGEWLLKQQRIILFVDWESMFSWNTKDVLDVLRAGARVIIIKSGGLPSDFEEFGITRAPPPLTADKPTPS
jgi:hypothetical protein